MRKIIFALCLLTGGLIHAQTPSNDPNWQKVDSLSDEFKYDSGGVGYKNGISANSPSSRWEILSECASPSYGVNWGGSSAFNNDSAYARVYPRTGNGYLCLVVDGSNNSKCGAGWTCKAAGSYGPDSSSNCAFNTGGIQSTKFDYTYGYFEISAKLPGNYHGGIPIGTKYWPAFWTYVQKGISCPDSIHNEMDILEPNGTQYAGTTNVCGFWHETDTGICHGSKIQYTKTSAIPLFLGFNKYAVEWNSNRMVFYFNDTAIGQSFNNPHFTNQGNQRVVIDQQLDASVYFSPYATFPDTTKVDYFRYYKLKLDCSIDSTFRNNGDISTFPYMVMDKITFGNGSASIDFTSISPPSGKLFVFRAVNGFTIPNSGKSFKVPAGKQLILIPTACN